LIFFFSHLIFLPRQLKISIFFFFFCFHNFKFSFESVGTLTSDYGRTFTSSTGAGSLFNNVYIFLIGPGFRFIGSLSIIREISVVDNCISCCFSSAFYQEKSENEKGGHLSSQASSVHPPKNLSTLILGCADGNVYIEQRFRSY
jgi:hypothetical protein